MACVPVGISLLGLFWPPVASGDRAFAAVAWLGLAAHSSRFGPTVGGGDPPPCDDVIARPATAALGMTLGGDVDGRPIGTVDLHGERNDQAVSWTADVATQAAFGQYGLVRVGGTTWVRRPGSGWTTLGDPSYLSPAADLPSPAAHPALDLELLNSALAAPYR